jgi:hypothetical protein
VLAVLSQQSIVQTEQRAVLADLLQGQAAQREEQRKEREEQRTERDEQRKERDE